MLNASLFRLLMCVLCLSLWLTPSRSQASPEVIEVVEVRMEPAEAPDSGWALSSTFNFELNPRLEEAVNRGLPLYFVVEFELSRPRWYWFDEQTVTASQSFRLSYNALTRQYRVAFGSLQQGFPTLKDALGVLSSIRAWKVVDKGVLKPGTAYQAAVRLRLDVAQMPKPFQVNAITNRDWTLSSEWRRFIFVPGPETSR